MVTASMPDSTHALRSALKSQYHASLAMLRQTIDRCPDELWASGEYRNSFWRIAYHALYYTDLYLYPNEYAFRPWQHHQTRIQHMDDAPEPVEEPWLELPHQPPRTGKPYTKAQILEYWKLCDDKVDGALDAMDLADPESGFSWYKLPKAEHQIVSIRHIQHHTGQLSDRVRARANVGIAWKGGRREER
jgi:hypothetical protein